MFKIAFTSSMYARGVYVKVLTDEGISGFAAGAAVVAACTDQMGVVDLDSFLNFADTGAGVTGGLTVEGGYDPPFPQAGSWF